MRQLPNGGTAIIVVPTTPLKKQWEAIMRDLELDERTEVHVINTVSLQEGFSRKCDLLVIDEIHLMAADKFQRIFERIDYSWILGLTATMSRLDGKDILLRRYAPVCDVITQRDAIDNGWISDFIEFNLAVPITREESVAQQKMNKSIRYFMSKFGGFDTMLSCLHKGNAQVYASRINEEYTDVIKWATQGIRVIKDRKKFLDTTEHKIVAAVELIEEFKLKTITFSQATEYADEVAKRLGEKADIYHANVKSKTALVEKRKEYKRLKGAQDWVRKLAEKGITASMETDETAATVIWKELKSIGPSTLRKQALESFERDDISVLCSAKALDQGFDVPSVQLGVDGSRSENPTQHTQRTGRVARNYTLPDGKKAIKIYVNLYIPDWSVPNSRDEKKLRKCQINNPNSVVWVDDLEELKEMLSKILKTREHVE